MHTDGKNESCVDTNQFEVFCPGCKTPILLVDGSTLGGVLLDDFEHQCGFRGIINWISPLATDPRTFRPPQRPVDKAR